MQRSILPGLVLAAFAPLALAVPDANGGLIMPADLSDDQMMTARLNYNVGFERFEKAQALENAGASLKGAQARTNREQVRQELLQARERFRLATEADPSMKEGWNLIGYTSRRLGDYEESLAAYDTALQLQPDYPEAIEYRAELFLLTGRLAQVREAYAVLLERSPSYAAVLRQSMEQWAASKQSTPAVAAAERAQFVSWVKALPKETAR